MTCTHKSITYILIYLTYMYILVFVSIHDEETKISFHDEDTKIRNSVFRSIHDGDLIERGEPGLLEIDGLRDGALYQN